MNAPHSRFHAAALVYATRFKFKVLPCAPKGKTPMTLHGCKDASQDPGVLAGWWGTWPDANVGIATDGLLVLDVDGDDGRDSLRELGVKHGQLPLTPRSLTGKGQQFFFRAEVPFKNRVRVAPGLDIRSAGGYVVAPPSVHPNGKTYQWDASARIDEHPLAVPPPWLVQLLAEPPKAAKPPAVWNEIARGTLEGARNQTVAQVAGHLLRRYVDPNLSLELLLAWNRSNCQPPLPDAEVERTVESIASKELQRCGGVA